MSYVDSHFLSEFAASDGSTAGSTPLLDVEGDYEVTVTEVSIRVSKKNRHQNWMTVTFTVDKSSNPQVKVGTTYAWLHDLNKEYYGASNAKNYLAACFGFEAGTDEAKYMGWEPDPKADQDANMASLAKHLNQMLDDAAGEAQAHAGFQVGVRVTAGITKASGKPFSRKVWYTLPHAAQLGGGAE